MFSYPLTLRVWTSIWAGNTHGSQDLGLLAFSCHCQFLCSPPPSPCSVPTFCVPQRDLQRSIRATIRDTCTLECGTFHSNLHPVLLSNCPPPPSPIVKWQFRCQDCPSTSGYSNRLCTPSFLSTSLRKKPEERIPGYQLMLRSLRTLMPELNRG